MKKILLFLAIALFVTAGIVTATKISSVNSTNAKVLVSSADLNSITPLNDNDDKNKTDGKSVKCDKEKCHKENCTKENCNKENCKDKCDKGHASMKAEALKADGKCTKGEKKCCNKDKGNK